LPCNVAVMPKWDESLCCVPGLREYAPAADSVKERARVCESVSPGLAWVCSGSTKGGSPRSIFAVASAGMGWGGCDGEDGRGSANILLERTMTESRLLQVTVLGVRVGLRRI